jgi:integrase
MGCIYRHKSRATWWIKYRSTSGWQYESSKSHKKEDATRLLKLREGDTAKGIPVTSQVGRLRFTEARDDLINYQKAHRRDTKKMEGRIALHLTPFFGRRKMTEITVPLIRQYVVKRQQDDAANGTINRELAWLKQMFTLALDAGKLMTRPKIVLLEENNARQGFFEQEQFESVLKHLPEDLRPVVQFAYITGWRVKSEVLPLEWRQVDLKSGTVRLEPGTTKNKEGRTFPMTKALRELLEAQHVEHECLKKRGNVLPWVFFRMVANGRGGPLRPLPIKSFGKAFKTASRKAGCPVAFSTTSDGPPFGTSNAQASRAQSPCASWGTKRRASTDVTPSLTSETCAWRSRGWTHSPSANDTDVPRRVWAPGFGEWSS